MTNLKIFGIVCLVLLTFPAKSQSTSTGGVFVLGGIHQTHEKAKLYTYERMGELYKEIKPDIVLVETQPKYVSDSSFRGTPFDFKKYLIPLALKDKTPMYGIDWWDQAKGEKWQNLQHAFFTDSTYVDESNLSGKLFQAMNEYFAKKDFKEINSVYITNLWKAKNEFKYAIMLSDSTYEFIAEYEKERNDHIVANILEIVKRNPNKIILVAIGIDHKYYIEEKLRENSIKVYQVDEIEQFQGN